MAQGLRLVSVACVGIGDGRGAWALHESPATHTNRDEQRKETHVRHAGWTGMQVGVPSTCLACTCAMLTHIHTHSHFLSHDCTIRQ